jgi:hypothetical protein
MFRVVALCDDRGHCQVEGAGVFGAWCGWVRLGSWGTGVFLSDPSGESTVTRQSGQPSAR